MKKNIMTLIILLLVFPSIVLARTITVRECDYTDEYKIWEAMGSEYRNNNKQPTKCKYNNIIYRVGEGEEPDGDDTTNDNTGGEGDNTGGEGNQDSPVNYIEEKTFSLLDKDVINDVRNQQATGACWAFSSSDAVYSNYLYKNDKKATDEKYSFSPGHIELYTNNDEVEGLNVIERLLYNRRMDTGGDYILAANYYIRLKGPVYDEAPAGLEGDISQVKFLDYVKYLKDNGLANSKVENMDVSSAGSLDLDKVKNMKPVLEVNDVAIYSNTTANGVCSEEERKVIKSLLSENGAVGVNIHYPANTTDNTSQDYYWNYFSGDVRYYNDKTNLGPNHAVLIVGWDDDVEVDSFAEASRPSEKGAWLVKNSHGTAFGNNGYFYISYESVNICSQFVNYYNVDDTVADNMYDYDTLGVTTAISIPSLNKDEKVYFANKFKRDTNAPKKEKIDRVTTYFLYGGIKYNVYYSSTGKLDQMRLIASGESQHPGYSTINIDEENKVVLSDEYAIIYEFIAPKDGDFALPISGGIGNMNSGGIGGDGESSNYYLNYTPVENVSYYAILNASNANWRPLVIANNTYNASIKVYTYYVDDEVSSSEGEAVVQPLPTVDVKTEGNKNNEITPELLDAIQKMLEMKKSSSEFETIENPDTGIFVSVIAIVVGLIVLFILMTLYKKKQIKYSI